jgi:hypothetical protein
LPYSVDVSLANIIRTNTTHGYLAFGSKSLAGTKEFDFSATYEGNPDAYRVGIYSEKKEEKCEVIIEGKPSDLLLKYIEGSVDSVDGSEELVKFRYEQHRKGDPFRKAIEALRKETDAEKRTSLLDKAVQLLPA